MGFIGCGDLHYLSYLFQAYKAGITGLFATNLTRQNIWNSLHNRLTYATTGAKILVYFYCNDQPMGSDVQISPDQMLQFDFEILGTDLIEKVELIKYDNQEKAYSTVFTQEPNLQIYQGSFTENAPQEEALYYLRIQQKNPHKYVYNTPNSVKEDYHQAWASPIWIQVQ